LNHLPVHAACHGLAASTVAMVVVVAVRRCASPPRREPDNLVQHVPRPLGRFLRLLLLQGTGDGSGLVVVIRKERILFHRSVRRVALVIVVLALIVRSH
jgi:hypothetical protein